MIDFKLGIVVTYVAYPTTPFSHVCGLGKTLNVGVFFRCCLSENVEALHGDNLH